MNKITIKYTFKTNTCSDILTLLHPDLLTMGGYTPKALFSNSACSVGHSSFDQLI